MLKNRPNEDKFDQMLERALQKHSEPVPADFTERMLRRIEEAEEQQVLARVVLQERLALAGCIVLGAAAIVAVVAFPGAVAAVLGSIAGSFTEQSGALIGKIPQTIEAVRGEWQFYAVPGVVLVFAVYSLVDLLLGDRLRIA
ncbi:MAG: hypothetical protein ACYTBX_03675 [Planctomycetota bacterium]